MEVKAASELRVGDLVWIACENGRTGARITHVEPSRAGEWWPFLPRQAGLEPVVYLEMTLGRPVRYEAARCSSRFFNAVAYVADQFELFEKPRAAR